MIITESGTDFGPFQDKNIWYIEKSELLKRIGSGIKSVEFIEYKDKHLIMLEAKTGCPNPDGIGMTVTRESYDKFYSDISEKFVDSFMVYNSVLLKHNRVCNNEDNEVTGLKKLEGITIEFVLVLTSKEIKEDWLRAPKDELDRLLRKYRKIWGCKISVLNRELAIKKGLIVDVA